MILALAFILYRLNIYFNKYLVPNEILITSNEFKGGQYNLMFTVKFAKGVFAKEYFHAVGMLDTKHNFTQGKLRELLSLTEVKPFYEGSKLKSGSVIYRYDFVHSFKNGSEELSINFIIMNQAAIDFAEKNMKR